MKKDNLILLFSSLMLCLLFTPNITQAQYEYYGNSYARGNTNSPAGLSFAESNYWHRHYTCQALTSDAAQETAACAAADQLYVVALEQELYMKENGINLIGLRLSMSEYNALSSAEQSTYLDNLNVLTAKFPINDWEVTIKELYAFLDGTSVLDAPMPPGDLLDDMEEYVQVAYALDYTLIEILYDFTGYTSMADFRADYDANRDGVHLNGSNNGYAINAALSRIKDMQLNSANQDNVPIRKFGNGHTNNASVEMPSSSVSVLPNPATDVMTVRLNDGIIGNTIRATLVDLQGTPIKQFNVDSSAGTSIILDKNSLGINKGIYYLKIQSDHSEELVKTLVFK